jgi:FtsZ-interacting cell division protein ZipA
MSFAITYLVIVATIWLAALCIIVFFGWKSRKLLKTLVFKTEQPKTEPDNPNAEILEAEEKAKLEKRLG